LITSFSQFLEQWQAREAAILAEEAVKHGPTIGDMYEGLTRELLDRAIPPDLGVRIVEGFVVGPDGDYSHQTDAMLVMGDKGRQLPKTNKFAWPIEDVLAVFEVKKTLYAKELADSLFKMSKVSEQQRQWLLAAHQDMPIEASNRAFARVFGHFPLPEELLNFDTPSGEILRTIAHEQLAPVRIVIGYGGYADEHWLRQALIEAIAAVKDGVAGPGVLPNLIICRRNALIKMNGHPFIVPLRANGRWDFMASANEAPWRLLLELIWSRLANQFQRAFPLDDTLEIEAIAPLLSGAPVVENGVRGWRIYTHELSAQALVRDEARKTWAPVEMTVGEVVLMRLAMDGGGLDLDDHKQLEAAAHYELDLKAFADRLVAEHLFAWTNGAHAEPIVHPIHNVITPDGKYWVANNMELLHLWVVKTYPPRAASPT